MLNKKERDQVVSNLTGFCCLWVNNFKRIPVNGVKPTFISFMLICASLRILLSCIKRKMFDEMCMLTMALQRLHSDSLVVVCYLVIDFLGIKWIYERVLRVIFLCEWCIVSLWAVFWPSVIRDEVRSWEGDDILSWVLWCQLLGIFLVFSTISTLKGSSNAKFTLQVVWT